MTSGKVAKNTAYLLGAFVGQKVLAFVYFALLARFIGVEGTGRYFIATSFTTIFSVFIDLGLANVLVREIAKVPENATKLLGTVLGIKSALAAVTVAATLVAARFMGYSQETQVMIAIACAVMTIDSFHLTFYSVMRGFQNLKFESIGVIIGQFIIVGSGTFFLLRGWPLPWLVVALLLGSTWNVLWSGIITWRRFGVPAVWRLDRALVAYFMSVTAPFALAAIFSRVYSYIDTVMLSRLADEHTVGLYGAAYKLTFAFQFLPMAFVASVYPAMSEAYAKDRARLVTTFVAAFKYLLLAAAPIAIGIFALANPIIDLIFGEKYAGAAEPLRILVLSLIFTFLYWPVGSLLNACDRQKTNTTVMGMTMALNVALNYFLIPRFGAVGAAWAALIGNAFLFGGVFMAVCSVVALDYRRLIGIVARIIGSAAFMGCVVTLALPLATSRAWLAAVIVLGGLSYGVGVVVTRTMTPLEIRAAVDIFLKRRRAADVI